MRSAVRPLAAEKRAIPRGEAVPVSVVVELQIVDFILNKVSIICVGTDGSINFENLVDMREIVFSD